MCGIAGIFDPSGAPPPTKILERMGDTLAHRGPDHSAVAGYQALAGQPSCGFSHRRLIVIDPETGDQPVSNEDQSVVVIYNGEIYNYLELREDLIQRGHRFKSRGDTEVLLHLFEEDGADFARKLEGMFAFAIFERHSGRLFLGRDRAGKKPLYYASLGNSLVFGSEPKALLVHPTVSRAVDSQALRQILALGYANTPRTLYHQIRQVHPASILTVEPDGSFHEQTYWRHVFPGFREEETSTRFTGTREDAQAELRRLLTKAVERRLVADVPLGAFLSGGIDSSIIVGLMAQRSSKKVRTFSIGFKGDETFDETPQARMLAERFDTDHTEFRVEPELAVDLIDTIVDQCDGPFGDSSAIPTFLVSKLTREHVTVALTGDGGDECFAGYDKFWAESYASKIPSSIAAPLRAALGLLPESTGYRGPVRNMRRFLSHAGGDAVDRFIGWALSFQPDELAAALNPDLTAETGSDPLDAAQRQTWKESEGATTLSRLLHLNYRHYLHDDLLVKTDRMSMAASLEARSPFLDTDIVEFAASLPDQWKLSGRRSKAILRDAFKDLLPAEILERPKHGFGVPLGTWFRKELRPFLEEHLLADELRSERFVRREPIAGWVQEHLSGKRDHTPKLWILLCLEVWCRRTSN